MEEVPTPFGWLPGLVFVLMLIALGAIFGVPALRPWRRFAWAIVIVLAVLFAAALVWTYTLDIPPN